MGSRIVPAIAPLHAHGILDAMEPRPWLYADFNGLFGSVLCLTHREFSVDEEGHQVPLQEGMTITAYDEDADDEGRPDKLFANGVVARPPVWLAHKGSRWVLQIDEDGSGRNRSYAMPNPKPPRLRRAWPTTPGR